MTTLKVKIRPCGKRERLARRRTLAYRLTAGRRQALQVVEARRKERRPVPVSVPVPLVERPKLFSRIKEAVVQAAVRAVCWKIERDTIRNNLAALENKKLDLNDWIRVMNVGPRMNTLARL